MSDTEPVTAQIVELGRELYAIKLYWVAVSTLWFYDYLTTLPDEIQYAWKGWKTPFFWLYILNRYVAPCFVVINLVAYFSEAWTPDICSRYVPVKSFALMITTFVAEIIITIRVYALSQRLKAVLVVAGVIMATQWSLIIYVASKTWNTTPFQIQLASLIPGHMSPAPNIPVNQAYHICVFVRMLDLAGYLIANICASLVFDALAFLTIMTITIQASRGYGIYSLVRTIQQDGAMYFFVLFSSNLTWLLLTLYSPPALKFIQVEPTIVISSVMINRITLNLKRAGEKDSEWSMQTFDPPQINLMSTSKRRGLNVRQLRGDNDENIIQGPVLSEMQFSDAV